MEFWYFFLSARILRKVKARPRFLFQPLELDPEFLTESETRYKNARGVAVDSKNSFFSESKFPHKKYRESIFETQKFLKIPPPNSYYTNW